MAPTRLRGFLRGFGISCAVTTAAILTSLYLLDYRPRIKQLAELPQMEVSMPEAMADAGLGAAEAQRAEATAVAGNESRTEGADQSSGKAGATGATRRAHRTSSLGSGEEGSTRGDAARASDRRTGGKTPSTTGDSHRRTPPPAAGARRQQEQEQANRRSRAAYSGTRTSGSSRGPAVSLPGETTAGARGNGPGRQAGDQNPASEPPDQSTSPPTTAGHPASGGANPQNRPRRSAPQSGQSQQSGDSSDSGNFFRALTEGAQNSGGNP